jgi:hypothetical protein
MAAEHPDRERPGRLEMLDMLGRDLAELTVSSCGIVFALHHPLAGVFPDLEEVLRVVGPTRQCALLPCPNGLGSA